ncbi:hypothetical protein DLAC_11779 [Tieghemostelium lacteum]|uniref:BolA family protein n=1 Tax=Tieghemostelium lacteum TaxID=361077 RepID=A0A151Z6J7_TIELA|nr:hypothetical protein DLAC_11779 [Tieghemostelium lacteum]|eukprot:KYQ89586.1 hypothetical protein DLAC_11779 [Tieghemostelium lacteum]
MITCNDITNQLKTTFNDPNDKIHVEDVTGGGSCGAKFELIVGSDKFEGLMLIDRHKMINAILADILKQIHALNMKTWTIKQYNEKMPSSK